MKPIRIPDSKITYRLQPSDIFYLEAQGRYTDVYIFKLGSVSEWFIVTVCINLGKMERMLRRRGFIRVSDKAVINFKLVYGHIKRHTVILRVKDFKRVAVSKTFATALFNRL